MQMRSKVLLLNSASLEETKPDLTKLDRQMHFYGVALVGTNKNFIDESGRGMNSQQFAFYELGLPRCAGMNIDTLTNMLKGGKIPELEKTDNLEDESLIAYSIKRNGKYGHFGVCRKINGLFEIGSKWGVGGHVYAQLDVERNGIFRIPLEYGNHAHHYRFTPIPF